MTPCRELAIPMTVSGDGIRTPGDLTPEWLTSVLSGSGALDAGASVTVVVASNRSGRARWPTPCGRSHHRRPPVRAAAR